MPTDPDLNKDEDAVNLENIKSPERTASDEIHSEINQKRKKSHKLVVDELADRSILVAKLFPNHNLTIEEVDEKYPPRQLKEGAMVTRIAPSPTGFMHIGGIYVAMISERLARQTDGVFYLRIEDTDKKREVEGASDLIVRSIANYGIRTDEGKNDSQDQELGSYGPYKQSERAEIYTTYVKYLVGSDQAYPCFCSNEELDVMRADQESKKMRHGYYGSWAKCRGKSKEEVIAEIDRGKPFIIRFKSQGHFGNKFFIRDNVKGPMELSQNDQDAVILKSDGFPTYHFAHVIDDHLMRTTHVIRGDEWVSSTALHLELFQALGLKPPEYGHIMPIQKMDGISKRKLSKRKDMEASVAFYDKEGYPQDAVIEYLLNLANSNFEGWRNQNPTKDNREFQLTLEKLAHSNGALFDFKKLDNISREKIARYSVDQVYTMVLDWAKKHNIEFSELLEKDTVYTKNILSIDRGGPKARKDITKWADVEKEIRYFFDAKFQTTLEEMAAMIQGIDIQDVKSIVDDFMGIYDTIASKEEWLEKIRQIGLKHGYAESVKDHRANPNRYKGSIIDVTRIFRVMLTGRIQTPDLYTIMQVMGKDRVHRRLANITFQNSATIFSLRPDKNLGSKGNL